MDRQELSCALRALTLCDGQVAASVPPRTVSTLCYCEALAEAESRELGALASAVRTERARVVAHADEVLRLREQRSRWQGSDF